MPCCPFSDKKASQVVAKTNRSYVFILAVNRHYFGYKLRRFYTLIALGIREENYRVYLYIGRSKAKSRTDTLMSPP